MWQTGKRTRTVRLVRLDEQIASVDVVKIDVEGYEGEVIAGAKQLLSDPDRRPRLVLIEIHADLMLQAGWTTVGLNDALDELGYNVDSSLDRHWVARAAHSVRPQRQPT
jgi:hypothetical protein